MNNLKIVATTFHQLYTGFGNLAGAAAKTRSNLEAGSAASLGSADLDGAAGDLIDHFADLMDTVDDTAQDMRDRLADVLQRFQEVDTDNGGQIVSSWNGGS